MGFAVLRDDAVLENPPALPKAAAESVVPGCTICSKRSNTTTQFLEHIAKDSIPRLIEGLSQGKE